VRRLQYEDGESYKDDVVVKWLRCGMIEKRKRKKKRRAEWQKMYKKERQPGASVLLCGG
jgi:hypothetical protein